MCTAPLLDSTVMHAHESTHTCTSTYGASCGRHPPSHHLIEDLDRRMNAGCAETTADPRAAPALGIPFPCKCCLVVGAAAYSADTDRGQQRPARHPHLQ